MTGSRPAAGAWPGEMDPAHRAVPGDGEEGADRGAAAGERPQGAGDALRGAPAVGLQTRDESGNGDDITMVKHGYGLRGREKQGYRQQ